MSNQNRTEGVTRSISYKYILSVAKSEEETKLYAYA